MSIFDVLILGFLARGPAHGYELKKRVEAKSGGTVKLENKVLYSTLRAFQETGAVTSVLEPQAGSPPRRVFTLTEAGGEQLREMLEDFGEQQAQDEGEFLVRYWFFDELSPTARRLVLERRRDALRSHLERVERAAERMAAGGDPVYDLGLVDLSGRKTRAELGWVEEWILREEEAGS